MSCANQTCSPLDLSWKENCWIQQPPDCCESLLIFSGSLFTLSISFSLSKEIRLAISHNFTLLPSTHLHCCKPVLIQQECWGGLSTAPLCIPALVVSQQWPHIASSVSQLTSSARTSLSKGDAILHYTWCRHPRPHAGCFLHLTINVRTGLGSLFFSPFTEALQYLYSVYCWTWRVTQELMYRTLAISSDTVLYCVRQLHLLFISNSSFAPQRNIAQFLRCWWKFFYKSLLCETG